MFTYVWLLEYKPNTWTSLLQIMCVSLASLQGIIIIIVNTIKDNIAIKHCFVVIMVREKKT